MERLDARNRGCLYAAGAWLLLVVLAPFAAVVRGWRRHRRGHLVHLDWRAGEPDRLTVLDVTVDAPLDRAGEVRRELTRTVVALAGRLGEPGDVVHQVVRLPWEDETRRLPVGPRLQDLGDRFSLALAHQPYARRTVVWLVMAPRTSLHEVVDPGFDPEAPGEPAELVQSQQVRWAAAAAAATAGASAVVRLLLFVPPAELPAASAALERLRRQLGA